MKKILAVILAISMIAAFGAAAFADDKLVRAENADEQIQTLFDSLETLVPQDDKLEWSVCVTDLDANGRLELVATCISGNEHKSLAKFYELSEDFAAINELNIDADAEGFFTDILADSADTYYDEKTDTYYYMFADDTFLNENEFDASKCSISLKDGNVVHKEYAKEHTELYNGITVITYTNLKDEIITPEEFNDAGSKEFADLEKSGRNIGWCVLKDVKEVYQLADSYAIFLGEKEPDKKIQKPQETPHIVNPGFLMITKNPTSENIKEGETAWFVAYADNWDSVVWTFVSPDGGKYSAQNFAGIFPYSRVSGASGTSLSVSNASLDMNGWGVFCTFYGNNQTARSNTAYINVSEIPPRVQLYASPSDGYFEYADQPVYLYAGAGDQIYWQISCTNNSGYNHSGTVSSGSCVYLPAFADERYDCYLYAYVVNDPSNSIYCTYVMDNLPEPVYEPDYEPITESMAEAMNNGTFDLETNYLSDLVIPDDWVPPEN